MIQYALPQPPGLFFFSLSLSLCLSLSLSISISVSMYLDTYPTALTKNDDGSHQISNSNIQNQISLKAR